MVFSSWETSTPDWPSVAGTTGSSSSPPLYCSFIGAPPDGVVSFSGTGILLGRCSGVQRRAHSPRTPRNYRAVPPHGQRGDRWSPRRAPVPRPGRDLNSSSLMGQSRDGDHRRRPRGTAARGGAARHAPRLAVLRAVHDHPHADTETLHRGRARAARRRCRTRPSTTCCGCSPTPAWSGASSRPGSVARYEARVGDNHHHLVCRSCGAIDRRRLRRRRGPCLHRLRRRRLRDRRGRGRLLGPLPRLRGHAPTEPTPRPDHAGRPRTDVRQEGTTCTESETRRPTRSPVTRPRARRAPTPPRAPARARTRRSRRRRSHATSGRAATATGGRTRSTCRSSTRPSRDSDPLGEDFDYKTAVAPAGRRGGQADIVQVMRTSQDWWPADWGHYGPLFIRMSWHAAGTYRIADGRGGARRGRAALRPAQQLAGQRATSTRPAACCCRSSRSTAAALSWADLLVLAGNVAHDDMGLETFGFAFGREDVWQPEEVFWGPEDTWLGDERYSGDDPAGPRGGRPRRRHHGPDLRQPGGPEGHAGPARARRTTSA